MRDAKHEHQPPLGINRVEDPVITTPIAKERAQIPPEPLDVGTEVWILPKNRIQSLLDPPEYPAKGYRVDLFLIGLGFGNTKLSRRCDTCLA